MNKINCPDSQAAYALQKQQSTILQQVKSRLREMPEEVKKLKQILSRRIDHNGNKERCSVVLSCLEMDSINKIAKIHSKPRQYVKRWLGRFLDGGILGLNDSPRSGRPNSLSANSIEEINEICLTSPDYIRSHENYTYAKDSILSSDIWTFKSLAAVFKVSTATIITFFK